MSMSDDMKFLETRLKLDNKRVMHCRDLHVAFQGKMLDEDSIRCFTEDGHTYYFVCNYHQNLCKNMFEVGDVN